MKENFNCKDDFSNNSPEDNNMRELTKLLPHTDYLSNGERYAIELKYQYNKPLIVVSANNCGNAALKQQAINAAKQYLKTNGIDANQYSYEAPSIYNNCTVK